MRRIIFLDPLDQLRNLLERAHQLDQSISIIGLWTEFRSHPVTKERLGRLPHVDVRVESGRNPLVHHHRLLE